MIRYAHLRAEERPVLSTLYGVLGSLALAAAVVASVLALILVA